MDVVLLFARLVLAAVFVVAGIAKLIDHAGSRQAVRDFGVPASLAGPLGMVLPLAELAIAIALVPRGSAWWGAVGALALLLIFVVAIGYNLARSRTPECHCFGQLHSAPAGWPTLIRNSLLAALAALAALVVAVGFGDPGASMVAGLSDLSTAERVGVAITALAAVALAGMAWLLIDLLLQNGRLLLRIEALESAVATGGSMPTRAAAGLPIGTPAPAFQLPGLRGEMMTLDALRAAGKPVLLVFSDPNCGACNALMPEIGRWQREHAQTLTVAVIGRGALEANRAKSVEHGLERVLLQEDREVAQAYEAQATPTGVLVRADGTIADAAAQGSEAIPALVAQQVGQRPLTLLPMANGHAVPSPPPAPNIGEAAPSVSLPDLDGKDVTLSDFAGQRTLVHFWNPGCGFCQRMLDDLKAWEVAAPAQSPALLVVLTGTAEANRAMGLRARLVLDQGFNTGRAFGVQGTPAAVLVDAAGRIASEIAIGAPAVLALAAGEEATSPTINAERGA